MYFYLMFKSFQYTILCYSSVSLVKKKKGETKGKSQKKKYLSCMIFFDIMLEGHISEAHYLSNWYHNEFKQHVACCSVIQSSI